VATLRSNLPHSVHASQRIMHPGCIDRSVWAMHSGAFTLESALERALVGSSEIHAVLPQRRWQQPRRLHAAHTGSGTSCGEPQRHLGTLVAAEFLAGTTGIGFVENVARKYMQYEVIWITIFVMGMLGLLFDITLRKIIDKTTPWHGKG